jgi:hypothetical protein
MSKLKYFIVLCYVFTFTGIAGAVDIDAGPFRSNDEARRGCPNACEGKGMTWNGKWSLRHGQSTICGCNLETHVNTGGISNNDDAKTKCHNVCEGKGMTWNGKWMSIVPEKLSVCECLPKAH